MKPIAAFGGGGGAGDGMRPAAINDLAIVASNRIRRKFVHEMRSFDMQTRGSLNWPFLMSLGLQQYVG